MPLIIAQTGAGRLPSELVDNAAFVKQIDFDPVHQTPESGQPAEKISGMADRFDTVSLSAEALAKIKELRGSPSAQPAPVDITDPAAVERRQQGEAMARATRSWNATAARLKQLSESSRAYGYGETRRLFQNGYVSWRSSLQAADPAAYSAWLRMLG